ncbi:MAG: element excision factor XisI family protein [Crocosphaera sp.]
MVNKIWIQRDGTEDGITDELVVAGVTKKILCWPFIPWK